MTVIPSVRHGVHGVGGRPALLLLGAGCGAC